MPLILLMLNLAIAWMTNIYVFAKARDLKSLETEEDVQPSYWERVAGLAMVYTTLSTPIYFIWYVA